MASNDVTDLELSSKFTGFIAESYQTALEFHKSKPDYSLLKFREIIDSLLIFLGDKFQVEYEARDIKSRIDIIHKYQLIDTPTATKFHRVRISGNRGVHQAQYYTDGDNTIDKQRFDKDKLVSLAEETRKDLVDIFESIHCTIIGSHTLGTITFVQIGKYEYKDIIFEGYTSQNFKAKLKAGLLLNTLISEQIDDYKSFSKNVVAHIENIELAALNFFDAACTLSANITTSTEVNLNSDSKIEKYIGKHADVEALYQYGLIALKLKGRRGLKAKAVKRLEYAANRGSIGAQIILGQVLISEHNRYTDGIKYINLAKESGCDMALVVLYKVHAQEGNSYSNLPYALECLYSAVELGVTLAKSLLAIEYLVGDHIESDYQKAILLLDEAIAEGSLEAIYAKTTYLNCQLEELNERISNLSSNTTFVSGSTTKNSQSPNLKQKTPGRNDPCICGSTKKYKKCCMNGNSHQTPHNALN